jgi:ribosome-binding ATPase
LKSGDKKILGEIEILKRILGKLSEGIPARRQSLSAEELESVRDMNLLTLKPIMYVANVGEDEVGERRVNPGVEIIRKYSREENSEVIVISARIESEIAELPDEEAATFLADLGLPESGLSQLIKASYKLLGLMHFFTAGEPEVRAWTIRRGTKAPQAAGKIHTDIERGFIRAEIVNFNDLVACGSQNAAREKGLVRLEGKEYEMRDGDVVYFRFNV